MPLDPSRTVAELRELRELTGDENGAQRVAWTPTWEKAKDWLGSKLEGLPLEYEVDAAGNQWWTLRGDSDRAVLLGGHIDSVPNGGWLDGCLNVVAAVEVLRRIAEEGTPPVTVRLVNWADEEGARFGRSLFGSSAAAGSMADQDDLRELKDRDGVSLPDALREHGVELDSALDARSQLENAAAYLELHIEQGPVLESMDLPLGAVLGTFGVERHRITWRGQAAHAGSTPMDQRRDALAGAAKLALELREIAKRTGDGAVLTSGGVVCKPGIVTSVVETAEQLLDMRHLDADKLASMWEQVREACERFAEEESIEVEFERIWQIEPILFDETLIGFADEAIQEVAGTSHKLPSGPLHDAAEVSRAGVPTVMLFVQSLRGLSHTKLEDTKPEHLELAVQALDRLATKTLAWAPSNSRSASRTCRTAALVTVCCRLEEADGGDAGGDERQPEQPARRDRVLLEADPAEVVDRERGDGLAGEDERKQRRRAELRRRHDAPRGRRKRRSSLRPTPTTARLRASPSRASRARRSASLRAAPPCLRRRRRSVALTGLPTQLASCTLIPNSRLLDRLATKTLAWAALVRSCYLGPRKPHGRDAGGDERQPEQAAAA